MLADDNAGKADHIDAIYAGAIEGPGHRRDGRTGGDDVVDQDNSPAGKPPHRLGMDGKGPCNVAPPRLAREPDLLPRVISADDDSLPELPVNEETGWQMPADWARKALERMGRLGWSRELAAQTLASCKSPEDAQELKDALDEEEAAAGHGTSQRLFGEADNAPA